MKLIQSKCLGIQIDKNLTWKQQFDHVAIKLNQAEVSYDNLTELN